jgi:hypothetical protein
MTKIQIYWHSLNEPRFLDKDILEDHFDPCEYKLFTSPNLLQVLFFISREPYNEGLFHQMVVARLTLLPGG